MDDDKSGVGAGSMVVAAERVCEMGCVGATDNIGVFWGSISRRWDKMRRTQMGNGFFILVFIVYHAYKRVLTQFCFGVMTGENLVLYITQMRCHYGVLWFLDFCMGC